MYTKTSTVRSRFRLKKPLMSTNIKTSQKILDASRTLFNEKGYAATSVAEIAALLGISPGNLTYHYPSKFDLVLGLEKSVQQKMEARWAASQEHEIEDDYVEHLIFAMKLTWDNRFLLRDRAQYSKEGNESDANSYMQQDLKELESLVNRIKKSQYFRSDLDFDQAILARTLWITSRYWLDHLRELEGMQKLKWADIERGVRHHFAVLAPYLTDDAHTRFSKALDGAIRYGEKMDE